MSDKYGEIPSLAIVPSVAIVPSLVVVPSLAVVPSLGDQQDTPLLKRVKARKTTAQLLPGFGDQPDIPLKKGKGRQLSDKRAAEVLTELGGGHKHTLLKKRQKGKLPSDSVSVDYY